MRSIHSDCLTDAARSEDPPEHRRQRQNDAGPNPPPRSAGCVFKGHEAAAIRAAFRLFEYGPTAIRAGNRLCIFTIIDVGLEGVVTLVERVVLLLLLIIAEFVADARHERMIRTRLRTCNPVVAKRRGQ